MNGSMPLISVIVPVYKVEPYLHRCVDSILRQTYPNLEIILIDDGSPDRCGAICDKYAAKDSRILVIHQENGGLGAARNAGLDICTGAYIAFVDSDDYIEPDMLEQLQSRIGTADFCGCGFLHETQNGSILNTTQPELEIRLSGPDLLRQHYSGMNGKLGISAVYLWGKLFRTKLFNANRLQVGIVYEDIHLMPYLLAQCSEGKILPYSGYHYMVNPTSITNNKDSAHVQKCYQDSFKIWADHEVFYHNQGWFDLETEVLCLVADKVIAHSLENNVPLTCKSQSQKTLHHTVRKLMVKPIGNTRKLRYAAFCLLGPAGFRTLRKIIR